MSEQLFVMSRGIRRIPHGSQFTPEFSQWIYSRRGQCSAVGGWGHKATADKARQYAARHNLPYIALEDGFLRSIRLGRDGEQPLSLVVDPVGIYYDARQPSQLEKWIESGRWSDPLLLERAQSVRRLLVQERLSKYNHAPEKQLWPDDKERVLVIDQTYGDMSVAGALASAESFRQMLEAALAENPTSHIVVKTHPDVLAGHRKGYIGSIPDHPRIEILTEDVHPWSVLDAVSKVYTVSSLMGFEALLAGKKVRCFGMPFYAGWGLTQDELTCVRRTRRCSLDEVFAAAYLKYARYVDPISGKACDIERIIALLSDRRRHWLQLQGTAYCSGVSPWKKKFLPSFIGRSKKEVRFLRQPQHAIALAQENGGRWILWASKETDELRRQAEINNVRMIRVEDAFLRSVGLGSDLTRPWSLVLDDQGIYYDCRHPSRLETLLRETDFSDWLLARAERLQQKILTAGLTKYNVGSYESLDIDSNGKTVVLVPGQVEDDASIQRGSPEIYKNLDLLKAVRKGCPEAYVIYKPHPDVVVGNRQGHITEDEALNWCDQVLVDVSMDQVLAQADEIHTMTSLTGFEALLRGKKVTCYGMPFFAGWGLTTDRMSVARRRRQLSLLQLIAGALILYPVYVDPRTKQVCSVEDVLVWLKDNKHRPAGAPWKTKMIRKIQSLRK